MNKTFFVFFVVLYLSQAGFAQVEVAEGEKIKQELKDFYKNPKKFKQLKQQGALLDSQLQAKQAYINQLKAMFDEYADRTETAIPQVAALENQQRYWKRQAKRNQSGVYFKVQIATLKEFAKVNFTIQKTYLLIEPDSKEKKRYLLGNFKSYKEAKRFSDFLHRHEGLDCYVVGYEHGKRIASLSGYMD